MRKSALVTGILASSLLLSCARSGKGHADLFENPLYGQRYYEELTDVFVELQIQGDPLLADEEKKAMIDGSRREALLRAQEASQRQRKGTMGTFIGESGLAHGKALLLDNMLYIGPEFLSAPGPSLHLFLTTAVDPRDGTFPDETAIDLGLLYSPYGSQSYPVPQVDNIALLRTAVLWDTELHKLYGFAQLSAR